MEKLLHLLACQRQRIGGFGWSSEKVFSEHIHVLFLQNSVGSVPGCVERPLCNFTQQRQHNLALPRRYPSQLAYHGLLDLASVGDGVAASQQQRTRVPKTIRAWVTRSVGDAGQQGWAQAKRMSFQ